MTARDELRDPWGWLVAAVSGGIGWAVLAPLGPVAIPVGLGIGAAVLGTKVAIGSRSGSDRPHRESSAKLPSPPKGSIQATLLSRAESAQRRIETLAETPGDDAWLQDKVGRVDDEVRDVVGKRLADLAGRVTVVDASLMSARPQVLREEYARMAAAAASETDPGLQSERQRAADAMKNQIDSIDRLIRLRETLLTRMQTAVVGLEGLGSRMGELVALGDDPVAHDRSSEVVGELTSELDNVRSGLAEAEAISRSM